MQCYEYLALRHYARRHLGNWTERYDELELAETLDEHGARSLRDVKHIDRNGESPSR